MLGLFLQGQGHPLPEYSKTKLASALSLFLHINPWSTREMIRVVQNQLLEVVLKALREFGRVRRPFLEVIVDRKRKGHRPPDLFVEKLEIIVPRWVAQGAIIHDFRSLDLSMG